MRCGVYHSGREGLKEEKEARPLRGWDPRGIHQRVSRHDDLRREGSWDKLAALLPIPEASEREGLHPSAPRLRWPSPSQGGGRGLAQDTRRVRDVCNSRTAPGGALGKNLGAILDVVEASGGSATVGEIGLSLGVKHPCAFARRHFPGLVAAGLVLVEGRGKNKVLTLADGWLERLEEVRGFNGEVKRGRVAKLRLAHQREAYRRRHEIVPDHHPANRDADGWIEDLEPVRIGEAEEVTEVVEEPEVPEASPLARALDAYLRLNPDDACQSPYWLGTTLWGHDLYPDKPTRAEVSAAIEELGGRSISGTS